jgi:hypothetical protein
MQVMIEVCGGPFKWASLFTDQKRRIPKPEPAGGDVALKRPLRPRYVGLTTVLDKKARDHNKAETAEDPEDEPPRRCERTLLETALLYGANQVFSFLTEDGGSKVTALFASFLAARGSAHDDLPTALVQAMRKERASTDDDDGDGDGGGGEGDGKGGGKLLPVVPLFARYALVDVDG